VIRRSVGFFICRTSNIGAQSVRLYSTRTEAEDALARLRVSLGDRPERHEYDVREAWTHEDA